MNKTLKILAYITISIIILFTLLIILTALFFPAEKFKAVIVEKASEALERPVAVRNIGISFFGIPALKVSGIAIGESAETDEIYVTVETLLVRVNLIKLLKKQVEIVSVDLDTPHISLKISPVEKETRNADNTALQKFTPPEIPALPVPVSLNSLRIRKGTVDIVNESDGTKAFIGDISQRLTLDIAQDLTSITSNGTTTLDEIAVTPAEPLPSLQDLTVQIVHELSGDLTTGNIALTGGELTIGELPFVFNAQVKNWTESTFDISSTKLDPADIIALTPAALLHDFGTIDTDGAISLNINGSVDISSGEPVIAYTGGIDIDGVRVETELLPRAIDSITANITFDENNLNIGNLSVGAGTSQISVSGLVTSYAELPAADVSVKGTVDIADAAGSLPELKEYNPGGTVALDLIISGSLEDLTLLEPDGSVNLNAVSFTVPETLNNPSTVSGSISLSPDTVLIETIGMTSGESDFNFSGRLDGYKNLAFPEVGVTAAFNGLLTSSLIDLGNLLVKSEEESAPKEPFNLEETLKTLPIPPNLSVETAFDFGKIVSGKLSAESAEGTVLYESGIFELRDCAVTAYNGTADGTAKVDFSDIGNVSYSGDFALKGFDSGTFISELFDTGDVIGGILSSSVSFSGAGLDSLSIVKNLTCSGDMRFENGRIKDWDFTNKLGDYLQFLDFGIVNFDTIVNSFTISGGRLYTPDMGLGTEYGMISVDGSAGFDTTIDYTITMLLNKDAASKAANSISELAKLTGETPDTLELIVETDGTFKNPSFRLDTSKAQQRIKEEIKTKAQEYIDEKLEDSGLKEKGEQLLKQLFR